MLAGWRPALRIARRTARRAPGRTALVTVLIGVPVAAASWIAILTTSTHPTGERLARQLVGTADASAIVTVAPQVTVGEYMMSHDTAGYSASGPDAERDPARVDIRPLLPAGTRIATALADRQPTQIRTGKTAAGYATVVVDADSPLIRGTVRLDAGTLPSGARQVALSPALAAQLGLLLGDELRPGAGFDTVDGSRYDVVGLARSVEHPGRRMVWAAPGSPLDKPGGGPIRYLVDLPDNADVRLLQQRLADHGIVLTPRGWIAHPPQGEVRTSDLRAWAAVALVVGFGVLEIVLLAGTAFAVGARRQTRELGLVTAAGGTPAVVRRVVLAQGLVLGLVGATGGLAAAALTAVVGRPWWETLMDRLIDDWDVPVVALTGIAVIGMLTGLVAAVVPAISAGRRDPTAALAGRFTVAPGNTRIARGALALVVVGAGLVVVGTADLGAAYAEHARIPADSPGAGTSGLTPNGPVALVLLGVTGVIAGLVWLLPNLIAKVALLGGSLPVSLRLAMRDAARHRHRTGPAAAAIMIAVGGALAVAFALSNTFAKDARHYVPSGHHGDAVVSMDKTRDQLTTGPLVYSAQLAERVRAVLPAGRSFPIGVLLPPAGHGSPSGDGPLAVSGPPFACGAGTCTSSQPLSVVPPDHVARFPGSGPAAARRLRDGQVLTSDSTMLSAARVRLTYHDVPDQHPTASPDATLPVASAAELPRVRPFDHAAVVGPETARTLGRVSITEIHYELTRPPTRRELAAAADILGSADALIVERGYRSPANTSLLALLGAATVVTLLGVAMSVALSTAEARADLATLAAVGASPGRRRRLAATQAWFLGQLGCLLAVIVSGLYGYTAHVTIGSPYFAIPWREIAGVVLAVPAFAAVVGWLLTRSELPMVRRIE